MKKRVVMGFLGTKLDMGFGPDRWERWRPTVSICSQEGSMVDRYELLYEQRYQKLADRVMEDLRQVSPETDVRGHIVGIRKPWDFEDVFGHLHDFLKGYDFDVEKEEYEAHITTGTHVAQICLFLLTESRHLPGKLLQTGPPRGRKAKTGFGSVSLIDLDLSKYDQLATRFNAEQLEALDFLKSGIATRNKAFNELIEKIEVVALRSAAPILLTGPTGAGKSQLARRIYELRQQRGGLDGGFVEVNCATLRGDTAMSALFGHKKGAFTGAQSDRPGLLRQAHGGMLFLDEIGELGVDEQAVLLRAVEEGMYLPVGADQPVKSKFQLIAGTNRDLSKEVSSGGFREDLLARINVWTFQLPGLADRTEDIEPNLDYELREFSNKNGRAVTFNKEARQNFLQFAKSPQAPWRGNFRDLNAAISRMATLAPQGRIRAEEVADECKRLTQSWHRPEEASIANDLSEVLEPDVLENIDPFDAVQLSYVVEVCRKSKNISEAGRTLFAVSRAQKKTSNDSDRLRKYLAKFELQFGDL
ncbi:RNA repair transcriptional activator RtcR [Verrucomicrobiaceae bacterium 5K15]|uniref:Sigma 54-interacting transcriptional regulator n=1 Tax=Oceaniferula flava TaxID=2800421 RepID=A0AAE2V7X7_9BACT|nr:RNA repair transcriptional activator RtcR [Oceaniferula flavus]MBK1854622.1 sigma 54-interacting transcriptional regulator [Oceaniferula flavus]MBM1135928.1 RNA repair transcriptional activator RtcR [Oceaniferula flavus]